MPRNCSTNTASNSHFCFSPGLPSAPRHLRNVTINQTTVSLSWSHPHHRGGRTDLYYDIECKMVCRKDQRSCSQDCGSQVLFLPRKTNLSHTKVTVTNLFPRTAYSFRVYAKNGVSAVAEKEGFPSKFAHVEVRTLESGIIRRRNLEDFDCHPSHDFFSSSQPHETFVFYFVILFLFILLARTSEHPRAV